MLLRTHELEKRVDELVHDTKVKQGWDRGFKETNQKLYGSKTVKTC